MANKEGIKSIAIRRFDYFSWDLMKRFVDKIASAKNEAKKHKKLFQSQFIREEYPEVAALN